MIRCGMPNKPISLYLYLPQIKITDPLPSKRSCRITGCCGSCSVPESEPPDHDTFLFMEKHADVQEQQ